MDKQAIKNNLVAVLNTLDEISVSGKKSVTKLAAIMNHLDGMVEKLGEDIKAETEASEA